jgi:hypothetical protein
MPTKIKVTAAQRTELNRRVGLLLHKTYPESGWCMRRPESIADIKAMRKLQIETFGPEYVNMDENAAIQGIQALDKINPLSWRLLMDTKNTCQGFYCQFFLHPRTFARLKSGQLKEHHIEPKHVRGLEIDRGQILHICDVVAAVEKRRQIARLLFLDMMNLHKSLVQCGFRVQIISAIAATHDGARLCNDTGMEPTHTYPPDKNGFVPIFYELKQNDNNEKGISRIASLYMKSTGPIVPVISQQRDLFD